MTNTQASPWLLLIPQLPAKPAYLRVKVWRRLQAIGAAPLKNAVHALPNREDTRALFEELHREITENGGEALILEARLVGGMGDAELRGVFDAARDADYEELAREARALCEGEYVAAADVGRLRKRLNEVAAIDFFGAHGRQAAQADALAFETEKLAAFDSWKNGLEGAGLNQERRPLLLKPKEWQWSWQPDGLQLNFWLPAGCYATSIIRELVLVDHVENHEDSGQ